MWAKDAYVISPNTIVYNTLHTDADEQKDIMIKSYPALEGCLSRFVARVDKKQR